MKHVVIGVSGSISAYKSCDIVSGLVKKGVDVHAVLTKAGAEIITPLTLEVLSGNPVITDIFDRRTPGRVPHIALAKLADLFLVAPATADIIGKIAGGLADDILACSVIAARAPVLIAPAMNSFMYLNSAVQANMETLKRRGCEFIDPSEGRLACGDSGVGRLAPVNVIIDAVMARLCRRQDLAGKRVLVTAGPTREPIDPVRYITNHSTGKMGFALAGAAAERGAEVTLISGPVSLQTPDGVRRIDVVTSQELYNAVTDEFPACDMLIMAAAPADFTPKNYSEEKIKKSRGMTLELNLTEDILKSVAPSKGSRKIMGFAAETQNIKANALTKLREKNLDFIAANDIAAPGAGFGTDTNAVTLYGADGSEEQSGMMPKREAADWLLDRLAK